MALVTESDLLAATGLTRRTALVRHLKRARIPFRTVAGRIVTTSEAVTAAITGKKNNDGPNFAEITGGRATESRPVLLRFPQGEESRLGTADTE